MAWLGEVLPKDQQDGATPFAPRTNKDLIEEELFARRRDLFSDLDIVFFDTTSIYFEGEGGETIGQRGHSKDHRPDLKQMVVGMVLDQNGNPRWFFDLSSQTQHNVFPALGKCDGLHFPELTRQRLSTLAAAHHGGQPPHDVLQRLRLRVEFLGCRGALFRAGRRGLRYLLHLNDRLRHFLNAARLLLAALVHLVHQDFDLAELLGDRPNGRRHLIHLPLAVVGLGDRLLDQLGSIPGRLGAALRQVAHFIGNDCETHARFARPGRFHRRVERQNVRLEGYLVDDLDDLGDLAALRADLAHGHHRLLQRLVGLNELLLRPGHQAGSLARVLAVFAGHGVDLLAGGGSLFERSRLLGRTLRQRLAGGGDLAGGGGHLAGAVAEFRGHLSKLRVDTPDQPDHQQDHHDRHYDDPGRDRAAGGITHLGLLGAFFQLAELRGGQLVRKLFELRHQRLAFLAAQIFGLFHGPAVQVNLDAIIHALPFADSLPDRVYQLAFLIRKGLAVHLCQLLFHLSQPGGDRLAVLFQRAAVIHQSRHEGAEFAPVYPRQPAVDIVGYPNRLGRRPGGLDQCVVNR